MPRSCCCCRRSCRRGAAVTVRDLYERPAGGRLARRCVRGSTEDGRCARQRPARCCRRVSARNSRIRASTFSASASPPTMCCKSASTASPSTAAVATPDCRSGGASGRRRWSCSTWRQPDGGVRWVSADAPAAERKSIARAARERGLPLMWAAKTARINGSAGGDAAASTTPTLLQTAQRYGANAALVGRVAADACVGRSLSADGAAETVGGSGGRRSSRGRHFCAGVCRLRLSSMTWTVEVCGVAISTPMRRR